MNIYDFVCSLLDGVDLVKYDFLPVIIVSVIIILCLGVTFRALMTIFSNFFKGGF